MLTSYPTEVDQNKLRMNPREMKMYYHRRESGNPLFRIKFIAKHLPECQTIATHPRKAISAVFGVLCIVLAWALHPGSMSEGQVLDGPENTEEIDPNRRKMMDSLDWKTSYEGWKLEVEWSRKSDPPGLTHLERPIQKDTWVYEKHTETGLAGGPCIIFISSDRQFQGFQIRVNLNPSALAVGGLVYPFIVQNPDGGFNAKYYFTAEIPQALGASHERPIAVSGADPAHTGSGMHSESQSYPAPVPSQHLDSNKLDMNVACFDSQMTTDRWVDSWSFWTYTTTDGHRTGLLFQSKSSTDLFIVPFDDARNRHGHISVDSLIPPGQWFSASRVEGSAPQIIVQSIDFQVLPDSPQIHGVHGAEVDVIPQQAGSFAVRVKD